MVTSAQQPLKMTAEEYLDWEPQQQIRHEYVNGELFAMTGGTIAHNDIVLNLYTALRPRMPRKRWRWKLRKSDGYA